MNVRIEEQNLRFKISKDELGILLDGRTVHSKVALLDKTLVVSISPNGRNEVMESKLVLDKTEAYLNLLVPPSNVQTLFDLGENREGLCQEIGGLSVTLLVDMKGACPPR